MDGGMKRSYSRSDEEGLAMPQPKAAPLHERANERFSTHHRRSSSVGTNGGSFAGLMAYQAPRRLAMWSALVLAACVLGLIARAALVTGAEYVQTGGVDAREDVLCDGLPPFVVVVDAGSTGCRAHAFRVSPGAYASTFTLEPAGARVKLETPLASLAGKSADEVADAIGPMLDEIATRVPSADIADTPVYVWATAGARALSDAQQSQLWSVVTQAVRKRTDFFLPAPGSKSEANHFRTIAGAEEGYFAWLAANYVVGVDMTRVGSDDAPFETETVGALDVGGGSAQFVALMAEDKHAEEPEMETEKRIAAASLDALAESVYVRSYLGVGAAHAELRARKEAASKATANGLSEASFACGFKGHKQETDGVVLTGSGEYDKCVELIQKLTARKLEEDGETVSPFTLAAPAAALGVESRRAFLGMSLLFHVTNFLHVAFPGALPTFPKPSLREVRDAGRKACGAEWSKLLRDVAGVDANTPVDRLPGRCFDAALLVALLGENGGFGFAEDERRVEFVDDVDGRNVEWTMGAAMSLAHRAAAEAAGKETTLECGVSASKKTRVVRPRGSKTTRVVRKSVGVVAALGAMCALIAALAGAVEADKMWRLTKPAERGVAMLGRRRGSLSNL
jgi:apyrase